MESIEQPFDSITRIGQELPDSHDKTGLIETDGRTKHLHNGDSPGAENSPLHQDRRTNSILHGPQNQGLRIIIISSIVFAVAVTVALILTIYLEPKQIHGHAAVACDDVRCSDIGLQILKDGGNAVDAAVAAAFCLGVVDFGHSGIGGGGFAVVHDHKFKTSWGYNFREVSPALFSPSQLNDPGASKSLASVGVPGFVKGFAKMHVTHGKLPWKDLLQPAIDLAEDGFAVSEDLSRLLRKNFNPSDFLNTPMADLVLNSNGQFKEVNDSIFMPALALTLKKIQNNPDSLYTGALMAEFLNDMGDAERIMTDQDLRNYTVGEPTALKTKFKELSVVGLPPPAGGTLVSLMLNVVEKLDWKASQKNDSLMYFQLLEVFKYAFGHRALLGDPTDNPNMQEIVGNLTSESFAEMLAKKIKNSNQTSVNSKDYGPFSLSASSGTSHLSVIDSSELMVSTTLSINDHFGSFIMLENTGILLNDQLMDFNLEDDTSPNAPAARKRPQSSMSPTVLYNEEHPCAHRIIIGATNGLTIPTGIVESVVNSVIFKMNIKDAIVAPRVHNQLEPPTTRCEDNIPKTVIDYLKAKGHAIERWEVSDDSSMVMAIEKTNDNIGAYSDFRKFAGAAKY